MKNRFLWAGALALSLISPLSANADVLFDTGVGNSTTARTGDGPGQGILASADTTITQFGFYMDTPSGGNLKFMIWDGTNSTLLFSQVDAVAANNTVGLVLSDPLSFNLMSGDTYYFGVISDSAENVSYFDPEIIETQNNLSLVNPNSNYADFADPYFEGFAGATIALQLVGDQTSAVPEPSSIAVLLAGLGLIGGALYFGRKKIGAAKA